jgi:hypothetical protein
LALVVQVALEVTPPIQTTVKKVAIAPSQVIAQQILHSAEAVATVDIAQPISILMALQLVPVTPVVEVHMPILPLKLLLQVLVAPDLLVEMAAEVAVAVAVAPVDLALREAQQVTPLPVVLA